MPQTNAPTPGSAEPLVLGEGFKPIAVAVLSLGNSLTALLILSLILCLFFCRLF